MSLSRRFKGRADDGCSAPGLTSGWSSLGRAAPGPEAVTLGISGPGIRGAD
ncbi:hypothetical protein SXIM_54390 [Streptomyces xiamenensis]|uniref:Uncharacterized protein n=1 Tax=Streptomyces xiamenensis TaxID=408015 RepID=A0A0F7G156_9ACTN|nr:hypothetical protein SXIM_54390 [Streptomyces xiamenensis]